MISFNISQSEVNDLYTEQALKALEVIELAEKNSEKLPYRDTSLTVIYTPITNLAVGLALFVLKTDQKELVKVLGGDKVVRDTLKNMTNTDEDSALVDSEIYENFLEFVKKSVTSLVDSFTDEQKDDETSE